MSIELNDSRVLELAHRGGVSGGRITAAVLGLAVGVISRAAPWLIALCRCWFQRTVAGPVAHGR